MMSFIRDVGRYLIHILFAANVLKDVNANSFAASKSNVINGDDDGFVTVGKNNKPIGEQSNVKQGDVQNRNLSGNYLQSNYKENQNSFRHNSSNLRQNFGRHGPNSQFRNGSFSQQNSFSKSKGVYGSFNQLQQSNKNMKMGQRNDVLQKSVDKKKPLMEPSSSKFVVKKNQVDLSNFKPKVLVRGSGSYGSIDGVLGETVPVANSFQALDDQVMEDKEKAIEAAMDIEYENDWSLREMDFFYQNCHKYGLDPSFDDDDVQTEEGGMADEMRPEYDDGCGQDQGNCVASDAILFPMIKLFSWNIKGLNNSPNQKQVIDLLHKEYYSEDQYAVSIKEDTAYPCLHSPKTTEETSSILRIQRDSIRRIQDIVYEYSGRYQAWSLLQEIPNTPYPILGYALNTAYPLPPDTAMTKVIKGELEKIKDVKVEDVSLTCDTPLEVFNKEVSLLSGMYDDLFTYEVEVANIPCDSKIDDDSEHEADDDMGYDPSDVVFTKWLGSKFFNYKTMDHYTKKALWIYWIRGDDEVELTDEEYSDDTDEVAEVFRIDTNLFDFETPIPMKITRMIGSMNGTRTYHGSMKSHGLTLEFRPNPHQSNILASLSTIRLDVQNGQHVVGWMMDTVMEETYPELTLLETNYITKTLNGMRL
ncbi:hypothetical protein Tco_0875762 [Tanacetum coccineum]|uniref:Uncharacterized protein n=1 Tax=Tanacetum coccineum TaxID=301880 RepID=A0ABQ5BT84_9ASTR